MINTIVHHVSVGDLQELKGRSTKIHSEQVQFIDVRFEGWRMGSFSEPITGIRKKGD
jgi:hypothetical protein